MRSLKAAAGILDWGELGIFDLSQPTCADQPHHNNQQSAEQTAFRTDSTAGQPSRAGAIEDQAGIGVGPVHGVKAVQHLLRPAAHKAEHAVDLDTGAVVAVTLQGADKGDTTTLDQTLCEAGMAVAELVGREAELRPNDKPKVSVSGIEELVTERDITAARWSSG